MWYVYFLQLSDDDIYVGSTNDLRRRVVSHQRGRVNSTKAHLPVVLKSYVAILTEEKARTLERYLNPGQARRSPTRDFGNDIGALPKAGGKQFTPTAPFAGHKGVPGGPLN